MRRKKLDWWRHLWEKLGTTYNKKRNQLGRIQTLVAQVSEVPQLNTEIVLGVSIQGRQFSVYWSPPITYGHVIWWCLKCICTIWNTLLLNRYVVKLGISNTDVFQIPPDDMVVSNAQLKNAHHCTYFIRLQDPPLTNFLVFFLSSSRCVCGTGQSLKEILERRVNCRVVAIRYGH